MNSGDDELPGNAMAGLFRKDSMERTVTVEVAQAVDVIPPVDTHREKRGWFRPVLWFRWLLTIGIWLLVAVGILLRLTIQDRNRNWAVVYYMTPIPALPIWLLLAGLIGPFKLGRFRADSKWKWRSPARWNLIAGVICLVWTSVTQYGWHSGAGSAQDFRFVFWNVCRAAAGLDRVVSDLQAHQADVIALVEADQQNRVDTAAWQERLPEYRVVSTHYGGLLAIRGEILSQQLHNLSPSSWTEQFDLRLGNREFTLFLVDVASSVRLSRKTPLKKLAQLMESVRDRPIVIAGDFNTPDDSVWLDPLRQQFQEVFRLRGNGYAATWPLPLPVLSLDQVWVNSRVAVTTSHHAWSLCSDHRAVIADLSVATGE